jgi:hypothetical protein
MKPSKLSTTAPAALSELELESQVSIDKAAKIKGISADTFRRHYKHLINRPSTRRCTVKLRDALKA